MNILISHTTVDHDPDVGGRGAITAQLPLTLNLQVQELKICPWVSGSVARDLGIVGVAAKPWDLEVLVILDA